jgi:superoxide reductase
MNRRDVIKGCILAATMLGSRNTYAGEYEKHEKISKKKLLKLKDRSNPSVIEQKHVPAIISPDRIAAGEWFNIQVKVGFMKEHPSTPGHWITKIKLLVDGRDVAKTEFEVGGVSASAATFRIRLDKSSKIEAIEHCNLHGTWISEPVKVNVS